MSVFFFDCMSSEALGGSVWLIGVCSSTVYLREIGEIR